MRLKSYSILESLYCWREERRAGEGSHKVCYNRALRVDIYG